MVDEEAAKPSGSKSSRRAHAFPYQSLFESKSYEQLKVIAKQVFTSPIYNYDLFALLKKRLEAAYQIQQDFKYMLR